MTPTDRKNHAWWIHFGFLAVMTVAFVISAWDALFAPRDKGLHLEALGAILGASFGLTFTMEDSLRGNDKLSPEGWSWRSHVNIEEPEDMMPCFVTKGAPATAGCQAIDRVIVEPGP